MMMIRWLIEQIHKNLKSFFTYKHIKCPEVISYSCGEDLLNDTGNKDIVFLDIEMPVLDGLAVGEKLKTLPNPPKIIFFHRLRSIRSTSLRT